MTDLPAHEELKYSPKPYVQLRHPDWSINAVIYEVNIRQFTPEGTFEAFSAHLPRLKELGIDILWLMPINPIGREKRKGSLGSYYAVKDYHGVNPEFGTMDDLVTLVKSAHSLDMKVIIDWVANHTAWDNPLVQNHPEWYTRDREHGFRPTPWYDWDDIIDLDYDQPGLRRYMTEAMMYWVRAADIDGFRCDVAGFIPVDFWETVRAELETIKPVFMLAEWEARDLLKNAFDMDYAWSFWNAAKEGATKGKGISALIEYLAHDVNTFPPDAYRMIFTDNHDKNSWDGDQYSNFGPALHAAMVLAATVNGMPLVYGGQEAGLDRSLAFFDKDVIEWKEHPNAEIYRTLFRLKHTNRALWNGSHGGTMVRIMNDRMNNVISFVREKNGQRVLPVVNYSNERLTVRLETASCTGEYYEIFSGKQYTLKGNETFQLDPWDFLVLSNVY